MKKKQSRRPSKSGIKDSTDSSEDEKMKPSLRRSARKKKLTAGTSRDSGVDVSLIDSAYEADDSERSDNSPSKDESMDEYHFSAKEEVNAIIPKTRKRKNESQKAKQSTGKQGKKSKTNLNVSTSTPVFEGGKSREDGECRLITPEVTPILPIDTANLPHNIEKDMTPTLRRSMRKRSFSFHDPDLSAISAQLSFDSNGDSGIGVSPALKKTKSSVSAVSKYSKAPMNEIHDRKMTEVQKIYSNVGKGRPVLKESSVNNSCFGFDSITPSPVSRPRKMRKVAKKQVVDFDKAYRSPKNSSESVCDDSPMREGSLSSDNMASQENAVAAANSSSLFSDVLFTEGGDDLEVNRAIDKSYKGVKLKLKKSKPQNSRLDAWANSFNLELENIAKFDLNIE